MTVTKILLVEDDQFTSMLMKVYFENEGYDITVAYDAETAREKYRKTSFDLIFLDLDLPDEDGLVLLRQFMAETEKPFFVLTGRSSQEDRIAALELGALEYLVKPVEPQELSLRVRNFLSFVRGKRDYSSEKIIIKGVTLDRDAQVVINKTGETLPLTPGEFMVLSTLFNAPNRVISRNFLLDVMNSEVDIASTRSIDVIVSRLRKKIDEEACEQSIITTVTGSGYLVKK